MKKARSKPKMAVIEARHSDIHNALRMLGRMPPNLNDKTAVMLIDKELKTRIAAGQIEKVNDPERVGSWYRMKVKARVK